MSAHIFDYDNIKPMATNHLSHQFNVFIV